VQIRRRTCNGDCSYEPFILNRVLEDCGISRKGFDCCKTGFRPYDLAVQCALLISKHHLGEMIEVASGGSDWHWNDARRFCYLHLGYSLNKFEIDSEEGLLKQGER
jgi:hypothetical protein